MGLKLIVKIFIRIAYNSAKLRTWKYKQREPQNLPKLKKAYLDFA